MSDLAEYRAEVRRLPTEPQDGDLACPVCRGVGWLETWRLRAGALPFRCRCNPIWLELALWRLRRWWRARRKGTA